MPLVVPPAVRFPNPLASLPDPWKEDSPPEGPRLIPCEVLWSSMGGAGAQKCIAFNVTGGGTGSPNDFTRIAALSVDNSQCGADVQFVFTDTMDTVTIPAYSPKVIVPVFSQAKDFFLLNQGGLLSSDVTRFILHNTMPPPLAVPTSQEQTVAAIAGVAIDGTTKNTVAAAPAQGTLIAGNLSFSTTVSGTGHWGAQFTIQDGNGKVLGSAFGSGEFTSDQIQNALIWNVSQVNLRFTGGLFVQQALPYGALGAADQGFYAVNLYYRTP